MPKIGVIVGREWSWPPAFIEEVNQAQYGRDGGVPQAGRHGNVRSCANMPSSSTAFRTRCRTTARTSRMRCSQGCMSSTTPSCGRPTTSSLGIAGEEAGHGQPKDGRAAQQRLRARYRPRREPAQPGLSLPWKEYVDYLGGFPIILKDAHGGGWKNVNKLTVGMSFGKTTTRADCSPWCCRNLSSGTTMCAACAWAR